MNRRRFIKRASGLLVAMPYIARSHAQILQFSGAPPNVFTTTFSSAPENPISEGGIWKHQASPWAFMQTVTGPNRACGTQTGTGGFNDSYAYITFMPNNVQLDGVIYKDPSIVGDPVGSHELELLFRVFDTSTTVRLYECNLAFDGVYADIGRWNGPFGNFSNADNATNNSPGALFPPGLMPPVTGDIFRATMIGSQITTYLNKNDGKGFQQINSANDSTFTAGGCGMGGWLKGGWLKQGTIFGLVNTKFCFTQFTATPLS